MLEARDRRAWVAIAATPVVVLAVALLLPWDTDANGGAGFPIACAITAIAALLAGHESSRRASVARGALIGALGLAAFVLGTWVAYELQWHGLTWEEWGDQNPPGLFELTFAIVLYGAPAAALGAILGRAGRASRRLV